MSKQREYTLEEERKLVERSKLDPQAFGDLYERYYDAIFNYIQHRVASVTDTEDLVAQVFAKALNRLWRFRWSGVSIGAWLYRIAVHEVHDHYRSKRRHPVDHLGDGDWQVAHDGRDAELNAAEELVAQHQLFVQLHECLCTLKAEDHTLLVLRYFEGKPHKEIAEILGKRVGAVITRTSRAVAKLRRVLESRGIDHERVGSVFAAGAQTECLGAPLQTGIKAQATER
ncbi:MAG: sigma-70 family RNA polymerase sigma factor [Pseudomonadales bacterium]|nr:sigma-70 family RNA polymerase sigma factor [Pseudomonadales bacterium]MDP7358202.1 sigma-70 family RNA polymerase sigma factor [Pseudomonadales bacterium]MDP7594157.1 sigma-70 family RNA polymerase sigma factor [Pseudomonadales bacterium]HJN53049.1 sigma-70 family RNA polymerase sigma factor [Pseudomonadales bacterium]